MDNRGSSCKLKDEIADNMAASADTAPILVCSTRKPVSGVTSREFTINWKE
jgi:orotate phosphoribosyltransferase-like protein